MKEHLLTCTFKSQFGVECLGCGTQRSLLALLKGDFIASFLHNPGVLLLLMTIIVGVIAICKKSRHIATIFICGASLVALAMITRLTIHLF